MKAEFSEFTYGIALLAELSDALGADIVAAPLFPSLAAEKEVDDEESVPASGCPLFLHLKLAEYMLTPRATGWSEHERRFFRLSIAARSRHGVHSPLRRLSEVESEVYYAAPAFYRQREFSQAFASQQVIGQSRFIPLRHLPDLSDDRPHYVSYLRDEPGFRWHGGEGTSRHFELPVTGAEWLAHLQEQSRKRRLLGWRFLLGLRQELITSIKETTDQPRLFDEWAVNPDDVTPLSVIGDLRYLLLTHFGVQVFILRPA